MTAANSRSPTSAARSASLFAPSISASSSSILARGPLRSGQSKPTRGGAALDLVGAFQGGEASATPGNRARIRFGAALGRLQRLPARARGGVAENVGMAADHLGGDRVEHIGERERAGFLGHPAVIDDLELEIAELILERRHVAATDRVGDFIGFLDRIGRDGIEGLHPIPFAAGSGSRSRAKIWASSASEGAAGSVISISPIIYIM